MLISDLTVTAKWRTYHEDDGLLESRRRWPCQLADAFVHDVAAALRQSLAACPRLDRRSNLDSRSG